MPTLEDNVPYTVLVHTGANYPQLDEIKKWNDGSVIVTINPGSEGRESPELVIKDNFPLNAEGTVTLDFWCSPATGEPQLLKVDLVSNKYELIKDALFIREITIIYRSREYRFPVKNYLYPHNPMWGNPSVAKMGCPPHLLVRVGAGTLRHHETEPYLLAARDEDLATTRTMVKWAKSDTAATNLCPGYLECEDYKELPRFLKFREARLDAFLNLRARGKQVIVREIFKNLMQKMVGKYEVEGFSSLEEYREFFVKKSNEMSWPKGAVKRAIQVANISHTDEELGRQALCGPNAMWIRKLEMINERWLGAGELPSYLFEGKELSQVISEGRLFEITTDLLEGIKHGGAFSKKITGSKDTWYVILADCMFYLRDDEKLVPVLIRLENRNDGEKESFWKSPEPGTCEMDSPEYLGWQLAKMYFKSADLQVYSIVTHFGRAHCLSEMFAVSAYRNLPTAHPIFRILQPHIFGIIPVNVQARGVLVNPGENVFALFLSGGDHLHALLDRFFRQLKYQHFKVPEEFAARGVTDVPGYLYREDSIALWNILNQYIRETICLSYSSDEDIQKDTELQEFVKEIVEYGLAGFKDAAGFPSEMTSREQLAEYLTVIIHNLSIFHAAVNFQTLTVSGYIPNTPCCMRLPPPQQPVTMKRILDTLPVKEIAFIQMNVSNNLGQFSPTEKFYLGTPAQNKTGMIGENMVVSEEQVACIRRMVEEMRQLKDRIALRNEGEMIKYDVLSPDNIPLTTQT